MNYCETYKDSGVDWIGKIPESWGIAVLKRTAYLKGRIGWQGLTSEEYESAGDFVLVTGTEFQDGKIDWDRCWFVDNERYDEDPYIQLHEDDLLITKDGTIGKIAYVDRLPKPATLNSGVFVVRPLKNIFIPRFMYWALCSDLFPQFIEYSKVGTTIAHLYQKTFERFVYPLPSRDEQDRISAYLDKQCAVIDKVLDIKKEQLTVLEELRKSIIYDAVTKGLDDRVELVDSGIEWIGMVPYRWKVKRLKRVCSRIQTGTTPPTSNTEYYIDGTIPWFSPGCYDGDVFLKEPAKLINEVAVHDNNLRLFPKGSILIVGIGATIGKVAFIQREASCNQQIIGCVCRDNIFPKYLTYLMKVYEGIIPKIAQNTTLPIMDQAKMGYLWIVEPSHKEQIAIAEFLDSRTIEIDKISSNLNQQIKILEEYRESLIHECVTGKRPVTEKDLMETANV